MNKTTKEVLNILQVKYKIEFYSIGFSFSSQHLPTSYKNAKSYADKFIEKHKDFKYRLHKI